MRLKSKHLVVLLPLFAGCDPVVMRYATFSPTQRDTVTSEISSALNASGYPAAQESKSDGTKLWRCRLTNGKYVLIELEPARVKMIQAYGSKATPEFDDLSAQITRVVEQPAATQAVAN